MPTEPIKRRHWNNQFGQRQRQLKMFVIDILDFMVLVEALDEPFNARITSYINQQSHNENQPKNREWWIKFQPKANFCDIIFPLNVCCHTFQSLNRKSITKLSVSMRNSSSHCVGLGGVFDFLSTCTHSSRSGPHRYRNGIVCFGNFPRHNWNACSIRWRHWNLR